MKKQKKTASKKSSRRTSKKLKLLKKTYQHVRFLPAIVITLVATLLWANPQYTPSINRDQPGVLAKATNTSVSGLLSNTNSERKSSGVSNLKLSSKLNSAAQAKANHMIKNDYWAHVAPDGTEPWAFFDNAGYSYISAGENLAYGFLTSTSTVNGWMNSPSHKANMLNKTFTEVGFGIASTDNYVYGGKNHGPQTIVVAHYGKPQVAASSTPVSSGSNKKSSTPATSKPATKKTDTTKVEAKEQPAPVETIPTQTEEIAVLEDNNVIVAAPTKVSRIQLLTDGNAAWSAALVGLAVLSTVGLWLLHKGFNLKKWMRAGENFVVHHVHLDLTVLSIIFLGAVLLTTSAAIK